MINGELLMGKIGVAVVGLGRIASLLEDDELREKPCTHTGAVTANEDCVLVAGCDIDEERRRLYAERWNVPVYSDAEEMLRIHKPQIFVIATHPDSHYFYCALGAKMKEKIPVFICEKPLSDNLDDAFKIADITKKGQVIITNHERRYSKDYIRAKTILQEGNLGEIISVRAVLYFGRTRKLMDMLWDDGTHLIDAIMFLTGLTMRHKQNWGTDLNENYGTAWLEGALSNEKTSLDIPVLLEIGAGRDHLIFEIEFSCVKGRLRIGNGTFEVYQSFPSPYAQKFRSLKNTGEKFSGPTGYFANMLKDAVSCVKDPLHSPVSSAIDGLRVIEYLDSVKKQQN
ncbi:MAG: Gfo/Idh/MocA family oxidoreductase [Treponema sp.]|nr:Gfo/Idh/MocA family oxidoreductase [Treponema sp.]